MKESTVAISQGLTFSLALSNILVWLLDEVWGIVPPEYVVVSIGVVITGVIQAAIRHFGPVRRAS